MTPYSKYPTSAFTVNTGQNAKQPAKPTYATQPYRPPAVGGPVGGFGNPGYKPPGSSVPGIAPHALSGGTAGTTGTDAAAADAGSTPTAPGPVITGSPGGASHMPNPGGAAAGQATFNALPPAAQAALRSQMAAGMAYAQAHSTLQAPIDPSGQPSTLGQQYWVPNGSTIGAVTGYTGPQVGSGLYNGAAGEPGTAGYTGIGAVPAGYTPADLARAAAILAGGR